jgi:hypothetical protein
MYARLTGKPRNIFNQCLLNYSLYYIIIYFDCFKGDIAKKISKYVCLHALTPAISAAFPALGIHRAVLGHGAGERQVRVVLEQVDPGISLFKSMCFPFNRHFFENII